jgi:hypothetical protein
MCYTVYDGGGSIYVSETPPADMSRSDTGAAIEEKFGRGHMVITPSCPLSPREADYLRAKASSSVPRTYTMGGEQSYAPTYDV